MKTEYNILTFKNIYYCPSSQNFSACQWTILFWVDSVPPPVLKVCSQKSYSILVTTAQLLLFVKKSISLSSLIIYILYNYMLHIMFYYILHIIEA